MIFLKNNLDNLISACKIQFSNKPLIYVTVFYILGIIISSCFNISILCVVLLLTVLCIMYFLKKIPNFVFILIVSSLISVLLYDFHVKTFPENHIKYQIKDLNGKKAVITGLMVKDVEIIKENKTASLILKLDSIKYLKDLKKVSGLIKINFQEELNYGELNYGDTLRIFGRIIMPKEPKNPGEFDYKKYLERKHIFALVSVDPKEGDSLEIIG